MAGLFRHLTRALKAGLESMLEPADDPRETFAGAGQRQVELLARVREALGRNVSLRQRLERRAAQLKDKVPRLEARARQAVADHRDDLARLSLEHKLLALFELKSLEASTKEVEVEEGRIAIIEQRLTAQIEALRVRQELSAARYTAAESQVRVSEAIGGVSKELADLGQAIEQAEHHAEQMLARAAAFGQLADRAVFDAANPSDDPVGTQLLELDIDRAVEDQLAALKRAASASRA